MYENHVKNRNNVLSEDDARHRVRTPSYKK